MELGYYDTEFVYVVNAIIENRVNEVIDNNRSLLLNMISRKEYNLVKMLIENGADPNFSGKQTYTPLIYTIRKKFSILAILLIEYGADLSIPDCDGISPLMFAIEYHLNLVCDYLLKKNADINWECFKGNTPLFYAITSGNIDLITFLIQKGANIFHQNIYGESSLFLAARTELFSIMSLLIEKGVDINLPNNEGITPLMDAIILKKFDIARFIFSKKTDLYAKCKYGYRALDYALLSNNAIMFNLTQKFYLPKDIQFINNVPSVWYVIKFANDKINILKWLISKGCPLNYFVLDNQENISPLMLSIIMGEYEIFKILMDAGAEPDMGREKYPIDYALMHAKNGEMRFFDLIATYHIKNISK